MRRVVTIDGPAGAGKSSVAKELANHLGCRFLDTGAMYRVVTLAAMRAHLEPGDEAGLSELVLKIAPEFPPGRALLNGEDVTSQIRTPEVTLASKWVADSPGVRQTLVAWQRAEAEKHDLVTEGRDQGTIVFPDAIRKFYLTASEEERAKRRLADYQAQGELATLESVLADQRERDANDAKRGIAPMKPAVDARVLDTTGLTLEQVVQELLSSIPSY